MLDQQDLKMIEDIVRTHIAPLKDDMAFLKHDIIMMKQSISSIKTEMDSFHNKLVRIEDKIDKLTRMETEDVTAVSNEVEILKQKYVALEQQVKLLQEQRAVSWIWQNFLFYYTYNKMNTNKAIQTNLSLLLGLLLSLLGLRFLGGLNKAVLR